MQKNEDLKKKKLELFSPAHNIILSCIYSGTQKATTAKILTEFMNDKFLKKMLKI